MFDQNSRYYNIEVVKFSARDTDGYSQEMRYVKRRFIPSNERIITMTEYKVTQGDRLDNITARYLGDPLQFWRICDANNVMKPVQLEEAGLTIKIALPNI